MSKALLMLLLAKIKRSIRCMQAFDVVGIMPDQCTRAMLSHGHARLLRFAVDGPERIALAPADETIIRGDAHDHALHGFQRTEGGDERRLQRDAEGEEGDVGDGGIDGIRC
jgi:hypothetical protein